MQDRELEELVNGLLKDTRAPIWIMSEIDSDPNLPHEVLRMYSSKLANKYNIQMADFLGENTIKGDQLYNDYMRFVDSKIKNIDY